MLYQFQGTKNMGELMEGVFVISLVEADSEQAAKDRLAQENIDVTQIRPYDGRCLVFQSSVSLDAGNKPFGRCTRILDKGVNLEIVQVVREGQQTMHTICLSQTEAELLLEALQATLRVRKQVS